MRTVVQSAYNGVQIEVAGPKEAAFLRSAHEGAAFERSSPTRAFGGVDISDGKVTPPAPQSAPTSDLERARARAALRAADSVADAASKATAGVMEEVTGGDADDDIGMTTLTASAPTPEQLLSDAQKLAQKLNIPVTRPTKPTSRPRTGG